MNEQHNQCIPCHGQGSILIILNPGFREKDECPIIAGRSNDIASNSGEGSIVAITSSPVLSFITARNLFDIFLKVS